MKEMEELAPLLPALSWKRGGSCPHRNVACGMETGPRFGIKTVAKKIKLPGGTNYLEEHITIQARDKIISVYVK